MQRVKEHVGGDDHKRAVIRKDNAKRAKNKEHLTDPTLHCLDRQKLLVECKTQQDMRAFMPKKKKSKSVNEPASGNGLVMQSNNDCACEIIEVCDSSLCFLLSPYPNKSCQCL